MRSDFTEARDIMRRIKSMEGREAFMRQTLEYIAKGVDAQPEIVARNALAKLETTL